MIFDFQGKCIDIINSCMIFQYDPTSQICSLKDFSSGIPHPPQPVWNKEKSNHFPKMTKTLEVQDHWNNSPQFGMIKSPY